MIAPLPDPDDEVLRTREAIADCGRLLYDRRLTDGAGGNISARVGAVGAWAEHAGGSTAHRDLDRWCMSPRYAAHRWHWRLQPAQVLVLNDRGEQLLGEGLPSRDVAVHAAVYHALPAAGAVIHAHAPWCQVFAAAGATIPVVLQAAEVLGEVPVLPGLDEAVEVAECMAARSELVAAFAGAALVAGHGLVIAARDLGHALDAVERCEGNARAALFAPQLASAGGLGFLNARSRSAVTTP
jgi:L-fuculose-phosphate aldolase